MTTSSAGPFARVRELILSQLIEQALPSLAVAVARDGVVLWEEGFGWADRANRVQATPHTLYSLASISKPITTTGLMILHQRGLIELDRAIDDYLGDAKLRARVGSAADATVRRVANHTAGLPMHYQFFYADQQHRPPPFDETIRRYANLITAPGERHQYSNLGYGLLDHAIARCSGQSYADFLRREVFLPLGMTHASVHIEPELAPFQAIRYGADDVSYPFYDFDHPGGSAVFCSAHDLARFGMFHLKAHLPDQKAILSDQMIEAMQIGTAQVAEQRSYGVGWGINEDNYGYRSVGHSGGMGGVNTNLTMIPDERIVVVILANASTELPYTLTEEILADLLPAYGDKRAAQRSTPGDQAVPDQPDTLEWTPPPALVGTWQGAIHTYQGDFALKLWFKASGDIHAQIGDQLRTLVNQAAYDPQKQTLSGRLLGTIPTDDARRRPHELQLDLRLRGQLLNGAIYTTGVSGRSEGGAPERRVGNALGYWTELSKAA